MAFDPCPGCGPNQQTTYAAPTTAEKSERATYDATASDIVQGDETAVVDPTSADYVVTWDPPDTSKEKLGLAIAGGLAFLAPFIGFAVAAHTARKTSGFVKPVGAGALTFFAMRAAAVGVLHLSDNMPAVSAPSALGAMLPQIPRRRYTPQRRGAFGGAVASAPCRGCGR